MSNLPLTPAERVLATEKETTPGDVRGVLAAGDQTPPPDDAPEKAPHMLWDRQQAAIDVPKDLGTGVDFGLRPRIVSKEPTPKSVPEALREWGELGIQFEPFNDGVNDLVDKWADLQTTFFLNDTGLLDRALAQAPELGDSTINRVRGAYRFYGTLLFAPISEDEESAVMQRTIETTMDRAIANARERLTAKEAELRQGARQAGTRESEINVAADPTFQFWGRVLQRAKSVRSRASELKTQEDFGEYLRQQIEFTRRRSFDAAAAQELGLTSNLLEMSDISAPDGPGTSLKVVRESILAGNPVIRYVMDNTIASSTDPLAVGRTLNLAFQGSLQSTRLERLGFTQADADDMTPARMMSLSHPRLFGELVDMRAKESARRDLGVFEIADPNRFATKLRRLARDNIHGAQRRLYNVGGSPLETLDAMELNFNDVGQEMSIKVANRIDAIKAGMGLLVRMGADNIASTVKEISPDQHGADWRDTPFDDVLDLGMRASPVFGTLKFFSGLNRRRNSEVRSILFDGDLFSALGTMNVDGMYAVAADVVEKGTKHKLSPESMKVIYQQSAANALADMRKKMGTFGRWGSAEATDEARNAYARSPSLKTYLAWVYHEFAMGTRAIAEKAVVDTADAAGFVAAGAVTGTIVSAPLSMVAGGASRRLINGAQARRATRAFRDAAATNRDFVDDVSSMWKEVAKGDPDMQMKLIDEGASLLRHISETHGRGVSGTPRSREIGRELTLSSNKLRGIIKKMDQDSLAQLLRFGGFEESAVRKLMSRDNVSVIGETIQAVADKVGLYGVKVPKGLARDGAKAMRLIEDALSRNALKDLKDPDISSTFSADALHHMGGRFRLVVSDVVEKLMPGSKRLANAGPGVIQTFMRWMADNKVDTANARMLSATARANQESYLSFMRRRLTDQLNDARLALRAADEADAGALRAFIGEKEKDLKQVGGLESTTAMAWDDPVDLSATRVFKRAELSDLVNWAASREDGGVQGLWETMRFQHESKPKFMRRLTELLKDPSSERGRQFRARLGRIYLKSPGIKGEFVLDDFTQRALPRDVAKMVKGERVASYEAPQKIQEIERILGETDDARVRGKLKKERSKWRRRRDFLEKNGALAPDHLAEIREGNIGLRKKDLEGPLGKLRELGRQMDTSAALKIVERAQDIDDGRLSSVLSRTRAALEENRLNLMAHTQMLKTAMRRYNSMTENEQRLFNAALAKREDVGETLSVSELRKHFPEEFGAFKATNDEGVQILLDFDTSFRFQLLRDLHEIGFFKDKADFERFTKPYTAQVFLTYAEGRIKGPQQAPGLTGSIDTKPNALGINGAEFEMRRDLNKHKVLIRRQGRPTEKLFDSREEAAAWVDDNFGIRIGKKGKFKGKPLIKEGQGRVDGKLEGAGNFSIVDPHPPDFAELAGLLEPGPGLFNRLTTLMRDAALARTMAALDRPGWAMTQAEFDNFIKTPEGRQYAQGSTYVTVPNTRQYGPLKGKKVHRKVFNLANEMNDTITNLVGMRDAAALHKGWWDKLIEGMLGGSFIDKGARFYKRAITVNGISRNIATIFNNYVYDQYQLAVLAAGRGFVTTPAGRVARIDSKDFLVKGFHKDPVFKEAIQDNMIDDTLVGPDLEPGLRTELADMVFGKNSSKLDSQLEGDFRRFWDQLKLGPLRRYFKGKNNSFDLNKALSDIAAASGDKKLEFVMRRTEFLQKKTQESNFTELPERTQRAIMTELANNEAFIAKRVPTFMNNMTSAWNLLETFMVGRRRGTFGERDVFSQHVYQIVNNINRLGAYVYLRRKGVPREAAKWQVETYMQNYSGVPAWLRKWSSHPMGTPILSFVYEQMRIGKNVMKYKPHIPLAIGTGISALNLASMAASGINPYAVFEDMDRNNPLGTLQGMATSLVIRNPSGGFATIRYPAQNPLAFLDPAYGLVAKLMEPDETDGLEELALNVASRGVFGNPIFSAIAGLALKRNPRTGRPRENRIGVMADIVDMTARLTVNPWTPGVGSKFRSYADGLRRPARRFTQGRTRTPAELMLQNTLGIRVEGGFIDDAAQSLGGVAKGAVDFGTQLMADMAGTKLPDRPLKLRGLGDDELFASLFYASEKYGGREDLRVERVQSEEFDDARTAVQLGDDALLKDALTRMAKKRKVEGLMVDTRLEKKMTEQEQRAVIRSSLEGETGIEAFSRLPVQRKASIIVGMAAAADKTSRVRELVAHLLMGRGGDERIFKNSGTLDQAIGFIDSYLANPTNSDPERLRLLAAASRVLRSERVPTRKRELQDIINNKMKSEAFKIWRRAQPDE